MKPTAFVYVVPPRMTDAAEHNSQLLDTFEKRTSELVSSISKHIDCRGPATRGRTSDIHGIFPEMSEKHLDHLVDSLANATMLVVDMTYLGDAVSVRLLEKASADGIPIITVVKRETDFPRYILHELPRGFRIHYGTQQQLLECLEYIFQSQLLQNIIGDDTLPAIPSKIV